MFPYQHLTSIAHTSRSVPFREGTIYGIYEATPLIKLDRDSSDECRDKSFGYRMGILL
jgi:hypothetical protein